MRRRNTHIINDVSGFPDEMMEAVAGTGCGCVVMCPTGSVPDIFAHVKGFFLERLDAAGRFGITKERLCLDPGIGFGKTMEENLALIAQVGRTSLPGCAYLMAASRIVFFGSDPGDNVKVYEKRNKSNFKYITFSFAFDGANGNTGVDAGKSGGICY